MSSSMVERVARALYCADEGIELASNQAHVDAWFGPEGLEAGSWPDDYRRMARAAIQAMREPTAAILNSGYAKVTSRLCELGDKAEMIALWHAMIDAALAPPTSAGGGDD